jgi:hypothetical protein
MFKSNYFNTNKIRTLCAKNHGISYMGKVELLEIEYPKLALGDRK